MAPVLLRAAGWGRWAGPQSLVRILPLWLLHLSSRSLTSFASFLLPKLTNNNSKAQTTKQQLFHPSLGFGYSRFLEQPPYSSGTQERCFGFVFQSLCKPQFSFQTSMYVWKWNQKDKQDSHRCHINVYKGSLPQCAEPLHPKLVSCLGLGEKPPPPCKESVFRVCLSEDSRVRAVRCGKATV